MSPRWIPTDSSVSIGDQIVSSLAPGLCAGVCSWSARTVVAIVSLRRTSRWSVGHRHTAKTGRRGWEEGRASRVGSVFVCGGGGGGGAGIGLWTSVGTEQVSTFCE